MAKLFFCLKRIKRLFIQTAFILVCFLFFSFLNSDKAYATSCGGMGGNACTVPISGWSCRSLGNSYYPGTTLECSPCWSCSPPAAPAPPPPPPSQGPDCGSIGGNACSWAAPNAQPPNTCVSLGNTYDCSPCLVCSAPAAPPPAADCGSIGGNACSWAAPNAQPPNTCVSLGNTYDCSPCLVCSPPSTPSCGALGGDYCSGSSSCPAGYTSLGQTYDCRTCCKRVTASCGALGGVYCSGTTSCPSPLVSVGVSYDCVTCCGWSASIPACSAPPPPPSPPPPPPPPTCTVSLSPSSLSIQAGKSELLTANVSVQNGSLSQVNFSSGNSVIASPNPSSVSSAPYTSAIYGNDVGSTTITAQAVLSPSGSCSTSVTVSVEAGAWFQTQGGDVYTGANLSNNIPENAEDPNFSLKLDSWPGIITHQDEDGINLGKGYPSNDTTDYWLAESKYEGKPYGSFQFFKKKFAMDLAEETYASGRGDLPAEDGVYYAQSSRTLSGSSWNVGNNRWVVLLVEGDVNINSNIRLPKGSFLAIAATGNITFGDGVGQAHGMFVADGTIDTGSGMEEFKGEGVFAASSFDLGRDFEDERNDVTPIEFFKARPDFIMSSYKNSDYNLWWFFQKWQEIAP